MANNRMFLVYRPTGDAVMLGSRLGFGWEGTPEDLSERIVALFEKSAKSAEAGGFSQDDFAIAMECGKNHPHVIDKWQYKDIVNPGKVRTLIIDDAVPYGGTVDGELT